jgi:hypothetical protein
MLEPHQPLRSSPSCSSPHSLIVVLFVTFDARRVVRWAVWQGEALNANRDYTTVGAPGPLPRLGWTIYSHFINVCIWLVCSYRFSHLSFNIEMKDGSIFDTSQGTGKGLDSLLMPATWRVNVPLGTKGGWRSQTACSQIGRVKNKDIWKWR